MPKLFDGDKLESLLVANWTHFMDSRALLSMLTKTVSERTSQLAIINGSDMQNKGSKLSVSRFVPSGNGYLIWFELGACVAGGYAEATIEASVDESGTLHPCNVAGVLHKP